MAPPTVLPAPAPTLEREERCRERDRERSSWLRVRSLWWRLLRWDLDRLECEVRPEMTEAASSRKPMVAFWFLAFGASRCLQVLLGAGGLNKAPSAVNYKLRYKLSGGPWPAIVACAGLRVEGARGAN